MQSINSSPLFAKPSFMKGVARSMDLYGVLSRYNSSTATRKADYQAHARDWKLVGKFIYSAIVDYGKSSKNKTSKA